jgi:subtilisin family serine protease
VLLAGALGVLAASGATPALARQPLSATAAPASAVTASPATQSAQGLAANDPGLPRQWGLARIGAPAAWGVATGVGTTIAVVDSGIDAEHPDLQGKVQGGANCVGHDVPGGCIDGNWADDAGHGTHVAGIAAAITGNGQGVAGVAPGATLLAVKVLSNACAPPGGGTVPDCEAQGTESDVADGIRWAADNDATVINLSLGNVAGAGGAGVAPSAEFLDAVRYAWEQGSIPVLVAGNDLLQPGVLTDLPAVVVTAIGRDDGRPAYAAAVGGARWAITAPGGAADDAESCQSAPLPEGILSTYHVPGQIPGAYACLSGTSMAAPHVSGALAVLRTPGAGPGGTTLDPEQAIDRLLSTAADLGAPGPDTTFGAGVVDLAAAVQGLTPTSPSPSGTTPGAPGGAPIVAVPGAGAPTITPSPPPAGAPTTGAPTPAPTPGAPAEPTLPPQPTTEGAEAAGSLGLPTNDSLPVLPVTFAVLFVVATIGAHFWRVLAGADWARPTPGRR